MSHSSQEFQSKRHHQHIPDNEAVAALLYVADCLDVLGLSNWKAILNDEPAKPGSHAEMNTIVGRQVMNLFLPLDWCEKDIAGRRHSLFHEALHVHHANQEDMLVLMLREADINKTYRAAIKATYLLESERMIDALTIVFTRADLLPAWPSAARVRGAMGRLGYGAQ